MNLIKISNNIFKSNIDISLAYIIFNDITVNQNVPKALQEYISEIINKVKCLYSIDSIKNIDIIRRYRDFYWHYLNIDPTKTRPSSEALIRRILANKPIPQISNIVDLNNWVSIDTLIPLGAYDLDRLKLPLNLKFAKKGEIFNPIGSKLKKLNGKEIVLVDSNNTVIHQFPHRDSDITKINSNTKNMLVIACGVQGVSKEKLIQSLKKFKKILRNMLNKEFKYSEVKILEK
ncbi:MAG: B3/B4 domain-containing protein [Promethearchaeota archaeon]